MSTPRILLLALLTGAAACSGDAPPPKEAEPAPQPQPVLAPEDLEPTADEVPVAEDYAEQAEQEVKPDNLGAQLDALEEEIELDSK